MLPIPLNARRIDEENALDGCELVLFGEPPAFGLSCWLNVSGDDVPGIIGFEQQQTEWGSQSFVLNAASLVRVNDSSPICIALGKGFVVDFDPDSVALHAPANPGDLIVSQIGLQVLARVVAQPPRNYLVNLETGEATSQTNQSGSAIRRWSISIPSPHGGESVVVFTRDTATQPAQ